jgi:hypothetical protein
MKTIAPNTVLPKGARLFLKPIHAKIGGWNEMEFDASVERLGLTWYRVKGGMGRNQAGNATNDREDWVADIPVMALSVHDYQWREPRWGFHRYKSFDEAIAEQTKEGLESATRRLIKLEEEAESVTKTIVLLSKACNKI